MDQTQQPMTPQPVSQPPKTSIWLWIILVIVIIAAGVFFWWTYFGQKPTATTGGTSVTQPTATQNQTSNGLNSLNNDLNNLNTDLSQFDKIDASEDETPAL